MEMKKRAEKEKRVGYRLRILQKKIKTTLDCKAHGLYRLDRVTWMYLGFRMGAQGFL